MVLYRIARNRRTNDLSGEGARLAGGRWNPVGIPVLYTASSVALASMEVLVHATATEINSGLFSRVDIYVPDMATITEVEISDLPSNWSDEIPPDLLCDIGREWVESKKTLLMRVPSAALGGHEYNYLINPHHPDMKEVTIAGVMTFVYNERVKRLIKP